MGNYFLKFVVNSKLNNSLRGTSKALTILSNSSFLVRLYGQSLSLSNEIFDKNESLFSLWPNPVHNILSINAPNNSVPAAKIYDSQGRLIYTKEKETPSIDVSKFSSGLYLMKLQTENGEVSKKFIKQ